MTERDDALKRLSMFLDVPVSKLDEKIDDRPLLEVFPNGTVIQEGKFNDLWIRDGDGWVEANASIEPDWRSVSSADSHFKDWVIVSVPVHWINKYLANYQKWGKKDD